MFWTRRSSFSEPFPSSKLPLCSCPSSGPCVLGVLRSSPGVHSVQNVMSALRSERTVPMLLADSNGCDTGSPSILSGSIDRNNLKNSKLTGRKPRRSKPSWKLNRLPKRSRKKSNQSTPSRVTYYKLFYRSVEPMESGSAATSLANTQRLEEEEKPS